jgi:hypothetical protein
MRRGKLIALKWMQDPFASHFPDKPYFQEEAFHLIYPDTHELCGSEGMTGSAGLPQRIRDAEAWLCALPPLQQEQTGGESE